MLRTVLSIILLLSVVICTEGRSRNRNALDEDTSIIVDFNADSLKYTKWFELADKENVVISLRVDDTTEAGFDSDSFVIEWGYQVGVPCYDTSYSARNERKCLRVRIAKDTMLSDSVGKLQAHVGSENSTGVVSFTTKVVDTTNVPGYAVQSRALYPLDNMYGTFFRIWVKGLTGNLTGEMLVLRVDVQRRLFSYVKNR